MTSKGLGIGIVGRDAVAMARAGRRLAVDDVSIVGRAHVRLPSSHALASQPSTTAGIRSAFESDPRTGRPRLPVALPIAGQDRAARIPADAGLRGRRPEIRTRPSSARAGVHIDIFGLTRASDRRRVVGRHPCRGTPVIRALETIGRSAAIGRFVAVS